MKHLIGRRVIILSPNVFSGVKGAINNFIEGGMNVDLDNGIKLFVPDKEEFFLIDKTVIIKTNPSLN